jgi:hypothetical protein
MMRSFMTSGSLTWGAELDKGPNWSDATPFPKENAVMEVYRGRTPIGKTPHVQPKPQDPNSWRLGPRGLEGVTASHFPPP